MVGGGELGGSAFGILAGIPAIPQLIVLLARDDVEVDVGHGLTGDGTLVEQHVEALGLRHFENGATEKRKHRSHLSATLGRNISQSDIMLTGYDQQVTIGERADIQEGKD